MRKAVLLLSFLLLSAFSAIAQMDEMDFISGTWELKQNPIQVDGRTIHGIVLQLTDGLVYENNDELAERFDTKVKWELADAKLVFEVLETSTEWEVEEKCSFEYIYSEKDDKLIILLKEEEYVFDRVGY